ncbi:MULTISPECIES: flagellin N-terminal helical domain-containing protein [Enterobacter]|uniref:flagellin N-terminal helical domain-containing protein n=1 Tax=Enterobacter TaxID=547 RepID=UPI0007B33A46|nr:MULTISPECIES: flagellin [Enterobacter]EKU2872505.1 flagellin FliC [Enterobacter cloacae]ELR9131239.1 flagellin FliC [Enterobacter cloacae]KZQ39689.1 flagellin [Enterobacter cloacae subsp. dissolvens]MCR6711117.1 flagellin [Enterobacter bugandensis]MCR6730569.1 flagellin [Enterobacter cloacae]
MAQVINTNALSLMAQNNLNKSQSSLGTAIQRLSSGLRINSAKDDAAGLAISNRFTSTVRGLTQAARNANDGISLAQTTEGALQEVTENLQRIRELTVQAKSDTNSADDRASIKKEITARLEEIGRISKTTNFNGVNVLDGSRESLTIQIGDKDGQTIDINLPKMDLSSLGLEAFGKDFEKIIDGSPKDSEFTVAGTDRSTTPAAFDVGLGTAAQYTLDATEKAKFATAAGIAVADLEVRTVDDGKGNLRFFAIDNNNKDKSVELDVSFKANAAGTAAELDGAITKKDAITELDKDILKNGVKTLTDIESAGVGSTIPAVGGDVELDQAALDKISQDLFAGKDAATSGMQIFSAKDDGGNTKLFAMDKDGTITSFTWDPATAGGTATAVAATEQEKHAILKDSSQLLDKLDKAMTQVTNFTADLGAIQNRFGSIIANLNTTVINTSEARSRVLDADFSVEVSAMSRANILQSAGVSVLAQANQVPQNVLSLLR